MDVTALAGLGPTGLMGVAVVWLVKELKAKDALLAEKDRLLREEQKAHLETAKLASRALERKRDGSSERPPTT